MSNTFFQGGEKFCRLGFSPLLPPGYGPADDQEEINNPYQHKKHNLKSIGHCSKRLGPSQKTLRPTWCPELVTGLCLCYFLPADTTDKKCVELKKFHSAILLQYSKSQDNTVGLRLIQKCNISEF